MRMFFINSYAIIAVHANARSSLELKCHGKNMLLVLLGMCIDVGRVCVVWDMVWRPSSWNIQSRFCCRIFQPGLA